jgi:alkylglycerol monooxygenase
MIASRRSAKLCRMQGAQIIVLATPVFFLLIALEWWTGVRRGHNTYRWNDALNSIGLGVMSQVTGVFGRLLRIGVYALAFQHVALWQLDASQGWVWIAALLAYDFCYY